MLYYVQLPVEVIYASSTYLWKSNEKCYHLTPSGKHQCKCLDKTPVSPNCKTIPRRSGHRYIPPPIRAEHDMFVICLGVIGEGRAGHGQQVGVWGHQRGLRGAQQAPAGSTQAAVACQRRPDQSRRWGKKMKQ